MAFTDRTGLFATACRQVGMAAECGLGHSVVRYYTHRKLRWNARAVSENMEESAQERKLRAQHKGRKGRKIITAEGTACVDGLEAQLSLGFSQQELGKNKAP